MPGGPLRLGEIAHWYPSVPLLHGRAWGVWRLDAVRLCLVKVPGWPFPYEIDIERINSSAGLLDWIFQIAGKCWATPVVLRDLVTAFDDLFDPQATLCSCGLSGHDGKRMGPKFLKGRLEKPRRQDRPIYG
jgi:hypothetical protein